MTRTATKSPVDAPVDGALQRPPAVDASPPAAPVDGDDLASSDPSTPDAIAQPVDGSPRPRGRRRDAGEPAGATYDQAQKFAQGKGQHNRAPGSRELPASTYSWNDRYAGEKCQGQLRSVYARITVPGESVGYYTRASGKTKWMPVAVWCDGCATVWTKPLDPAEATRKRPGRW